LAALNVEYRDFRYIVPFIVQFSDPRLLPSFGKSIPNSIQEEFWAQNVNQELNTIRKQVGVT